MYQKQWNFIIRKAYDGLFCEEKKIISIIGIRSKLSQVQIFPSKLQNYSGGLPYYLLAGCPY